MKILSIISMALMKKDPLAMQSQKQPNSGAATKWNDGCSAGHFAAIIMAETLRAGDSQRRDLLYEDREGQKRLASTIDSTVMTSRVRVMQRQRQRQ